MYELCTYSDCLKQCFKKTLNTKLLDRPTIQIAEESSFENSCLRGTVVRAAVKRSKGGGFKTNLRRHCKSTGGHPE